MARLPEFNPNLPLLRLTSKEYAMRLRKGIRSDRASKSSSDKFEWPVESAQTTHLSVVDGERNAVALTYTLGDNYGSKIVVSDAGFLLNNDMRDFNAQPGVTDEKGLIGTEPNLAAPGKRMLSSMTPTILTKEGELYMVTGSPGGRTIINTVLQTILNVIDFGMNVQEAVDAPRFGHEWLPDVIKYERNGLSPDTLSILRGLGHSLEAINSQGVVAAIVVDTKRNELEAAIDRRASNGGAAGR